MVSNVSLHFTWYATRATSYPSVATMSNVTTYASTWRECYNLVDAPTIPTALPARVTSVQQTWQHCRKMLTVQDVSCFTNLGFGLAGGGFYGTWDNCWVVTNMPITNCSFAPLPSTLASLFANCSNMVGSIGAWTWRTNIASFDSYNSQIWYTNVPGCFAYNVKTNGFALRMDNSKMPADHVSQVLIDLDFVGATNGTVNVGGTTAGISNMPPNAAGYIAVTNLRAKGWTVTVN